MVRNSSRPALVSFRSTASPSAVRASSTCRRSLPERERRSNPLRSQRSTSSTMLLWLSCNRFASVPMVGLVLPGSPLMASTNWYCCGFWPASRTRSSMKRRYLRSWYRNSASDSYSAWFRGLRAFPFDILSSRDIIFLLSRSPPPIATSFQSRQFRRNCRHPALRGYAISIYHRLSRGGYAAGLEERQGAPLIPRYTRLE